MTRRTDETEREQESVFHLTHESTEITATFRAPLFLAPILSEHEATSLLAEEFETFKTVLLVIYSSCGPKLRLILG